MSKIQLVYFSECPNFSIVKKLLLDIGLEFEEIDQNNLAETDLLKLLSSPSILKNGELIFGQKLDSAKGGCSLNLPDKFDLIKKLRR